MPYQATIGYSVVNVNSGMAITRVHGKVSDLKARFLGVFF